MKEGSKKRIAKIGMKPKNEAKRARMDGSKKSRKSSKQGSKGRKEGRKEGKKEGRKELRKEANVDSQKSKEAKGIRKPRKER